MPMCLMIDRLILSRLESLSALLQVFQIFRGRSKARLCLPLCSSHRLAKARLLVVALVVLSHRECQSRKDPYLPLEPLSVRLLPRPTGLPPMAFAVSFRIRFAEAKTAVKHHRPERTDGRFRIGAVVTVVPRPMAVHHVYIYIESVRQYSCYFTALLPMCIRLT